MQGQAKGICLYGVCPTNRHASGDKGHEEELKIIVEALKFSGTIKGCRWDLASLGWNTTYVEFRHNRMAPTITIEDYTRSKSTRQADPATGVLGTTRAGVRSAASRLFVS